MTDNDGDVGIEKFCVASTPAISTWKGMLLRVGMLAKGKRGGGGSRTTIEVWSNDIEHRVKGTRMS